MYVYVCAECGSIRNQPRNMLEAGLCPEYKCGGTPERIEVVPRAIADELAERLRLRMAEGMRSTGAEAVLADLAREAEAPSLVTECPECFGRGEVPPSWLGLPPSERGPSRLPCPKCAGRVLPLNGK